jgi:LacI family transcriptional regulator
MPLVDMVHPPLTTVRIAHEQLGSEAVRLLLERIARPEAPATQVRTVPALIPRGSTAPANRRREG